MRFCFLIILPLMLVACAHEQQGKEASLQQTQTISLPATYAVKSPGDTPAKLVSSDCARNFDGVLTYLETSMMQNKTTTANAQ